MARPPSSPPKFNFRGIVFLLILAVGLAVVWSDFRKTEASATEITYHEFLRKAEAGEIEKAVIDQQAATITGTFRTDEGGSEKFTTTMLQSDFTLAERLARTDTNFEVKPPTSPWLESFFFNWVPVLLLIGVFYFFFFRQFQATGNRAFSFGKSNALMVKEGTRPKTNFDDVAGCDEAKEELQEVVEFLKDPGKFTRLGARVPKGVLLVGHPGCGKTLLAKAVAGEANVPFFSISGSDFVEMFVGVGASRVRDIFEQGRKNAPCIIFIDEIDAVGRHRGWGLGGGHDEREQTLNALLVQMDGFDSAEGVILLAATNRPDILDPALLRPGRFDRRVTVDLPDLEGRYGILKVHTKKVPLASDVDLKVISRGTPFFSGADLANLVNEAALLAARRGKNAIGMAEMEAARDKVMMGPERRSRKISDKEKKIVAYHEAGHALAARKLKGADPVHKVTLIPRGAYALGATFQLPERDRYLKTQNEYLSEITILLAGRAAEDIVFGEVTGGASNDLDRATKIARQMVCAMGMSRLGPIAFGNPREELFLGREIAREQNYSEETARKIDAEIRSIISDCDARVRKILTDDREALERITRALLEREILDGEELDLLIEGKPLPPKDLAEANAPGVAQEEARDAQRNGATGVVPAPQPA